MASLCGGYFMNWLAYVVFSLAGVYLILLIVTKIISVAKKPKEEEEEKDGIVEISNEGK